MLADADVPTPHPVPTLRQYVLTSLRLYRGRDRAYRSDELSAHLAVVMDWFNHANDDASLALKNLVIGGSLLVGLCEGRIAFRLLADWEERPTLADFGPTSGV